MIVSRLGHVTALDMLLTKNAQVDLQSNVSVLLLIALFLDASKG